MPTIDILDSIGGDFFGYGVTAQSVAAELQAAGSEPVTVRINSPGGSVFEGLTIYNMLRAHEGEVTVEIHGLAASIASVIALAGDKRVAMRGSMFMVHEPSTVAFGDAAELHKTAEQLESVRASMTDVYAAHSSMSRAEILDAMSVETWMGADEMLDAGFATSVEDSSEATTHEMVAMFKKNEHRFNSILAQYKRPFDRTRPRAQLTPTPKVNSMDKEVLAKLGLAAGASTETVMAAIEQLSKPDIEQHVPRAEYDRLVAENQGFQATLEASARAQHEAAVEAELVKAADKLTPATVAFYRDSMSTKEGLERFKAFHPTLPSMNLKGEEPYDSASLKKSEPKARGRGVQTPVEYLTKTSGISMERYEQEKARLQAEGLVR